MRMTEAGEKAPLVCVEVWMFEWVIEGMGMDEL